MKKQSWGWGGRASKRAKGIERKRWLILLLSRYSSILETAVPSRSFEDTHARAHKHTHVRVGVHSLCPVSRMCVSHLSVVIVPPEGHGGLESGWDSRKRLCFIHVTVKIVSGLPYNSIIESWKTHAFSSSQAALLCGAAPRGSREE